MEPKPCEWCCKATYYEYNGHVCCSTWCWFALSDDAGGYPNTGLEHLPAYGSRKEVEVSR